MEQAPRHTIKETKPMKDGNWKCHYKWKNKILYACMHPWKERYTKMLLVRIDWEVFLYSVSFTFYICLFKHKLYIYMHACASICIYIYTCACHRQKKCQVESDLWSSGLYDLRLQFLQAYNRDNILPSWGFDG